MKIKQEIEKKGKQRKEYKGTRIKGKNRDNEMNGKRKEQEGKTRKQVKEGEKKNQR